MESGLVDRDRIRCPELCGKIMSAHEASMLITDGMVVAVSGFTPSGYPKDVPLALAKRVNESHEHFKVSLYSGASLGPEIDEAWTEAKMIQKRLPYQTTDKLRKDINSGYVDYLDMHLSHSPQYINYGMLSKPDIAIVEAVAIDEEGNLIPTLGIWQDKESQLWDEVSDHYSESGYLRLLIRHKNISGLIRELQRMRRYSNKYADLLSNLPATEFQLLYSMLLFEDAKIADNRVAYKQLCRGIKEYSKHCSVSAAREFSEQLLTKYPFIPALVEEIMNIWTDLDLGECEVMQK